MSELLTVGEVAEHFRISSETVRALIRRGEIRAVRIGHVFRIPREEIARLLGEKKAELISA